MQSYGGSEKWDGEADVVVVGFGAAGASAAIEAADLGADVLVVERFQGGGATAISGGIYYAGGGTAQQKEAGFDDTPSAMFDYLKLETAGVVSDELLEDFCERSVENLQWLERLGVPFEGSMAPRKTSYPTNEYYLYYSGNELAPPYKDAATPAPRGHRTKGKGTSGKVFFSAMAKSARKRRGIDVRCQTTVTSLITDDAGTVIGVECREVDPRARGRRVLHRVLGSLNRKWNLYYRPVGRLMDGPIRRIEDGHSVVRRYRARKGVILAAGGFVFDREMLGEYAPRYLGGTGLGTIGDDGSGIRLGQSAGGATDRMERVSAWRFFNPPIAMTEGVLVNKEGERICNELFYGAKIGEHIAEQTDVAAYLVVDSRVLADAKRQVPEQTLWFQRLQTTYLYTVGHKKGATAEELARRTGIDPAGLARTLERYNADRRAGVPDAMGKDPAHVTPLVDGPFYAFDCSIRVQAGFPCPVLTLGGLTVDEWTGAVTGVDGAPIPGLYAAGRTAVGVCSQSYVSGLSIADCVYSGRRAGAVVARGGRLA
ncbi:FAD-binding protein [Rhodococcus hoagii]|uniref:FAD-binding protein n=2 Tax=Rhodococcus hoagii TaxID=43767 RepID=A0A9Q5RSQ6_RHOHA|nr:FAD-binding protein [Prescottella equi]MBM4468138.1 FAD-binding protein [Prescottella equi]MBM4482653.1 FAD-binding protein [Prescottella equi]MBM4487517.1 FAD-binding protein [Prescottella equi]MBM4493217.1 FAD-binding protein [Prescottella equi]MBM4494443.1 FAD-binding protein [Prescottella equi]